MTHINNRSVAALPGLLLGLGCLSVAPPAIAAQALTGPGRISLTVGVAAVLPADVRFVDGDDAGEAALDQHQPNHRGSPPPLPYRDASLASLASHSEMCGTSVQEPWIICG